MRHSLVDSTDTCTHVYIPTHRETQIYIIFWKKNKISIFKVYANLTFTLWILLKFYKNNSNLWKKLMFLEN